MGKRFPKLNQRKIIANKKALKSFKKKKNQPCNFEKEETNLATKIIKKWLTSLCPNSSRKPFEKEN